MIFEFARFSDIQGYPRFTSDAAVRRFLEERGHDFSAIVEKGRDPAQGVPFENRLSNAVWTVRASGGSSVRIVDADLKNESAVIKEDGILVASVYQHRFLSAVQALDRAIEHGALGELESALVSGVASIESYIAYRAGIWNRAHEDTPLVDTPQTKVSFDDKVRVWIPTMAGGRRLELGDELWAHFLQIKTVRDHWTVHPKATDRAVPFREMARLCNLFSTGIAGLLAEMHKLFKEQIPGAIIRARFAPDVEVTDD